MDYRVRNASAARNGFSEIVAMSVLHLLREPKCDGGTIRCGDIVGAEDETTGGNSDLEEKEGGGSTS